MNLPPQNYQGATPDQQASSFPLRCFPPIIRDAIVATCVTKKVPPEIVASVYLAAASLSCLSLVEAIPVHTTVSEPAVLNLLVIAKSGVGKSTALRPVMQTFYDFASQVNEEYKVLLKKYQVDQSLWEERRKALARNLRQATNRNYSGEDEHIALESHLRNKPQKPVRFKFLYQNISNGELLKSLGDNPEAGIIAEEAITFFKSRAKNDPGVFNLGWDGAPYSYQRDGVDCEINLRLMFCLMVQQDVFDEYISEHHNTGRGSGFLARFLMTRVDDTYEYRDEDFSYMLPANDNFDNRVRELLELAKQRFYCSITDKQKLTLAPQAIAFMGEKRAEMRQEIIEGGRWEHITDMALKSGANALRLATIFHYFSGAPGDAISLPLIESAHEIIEWYMQQASKIFYHNSRLFQFEQDVLEVYNWIYNRMMIDGQAIIAKSDIMRLGPKHKTNNLRLAAKLEPILDQLNWQKRIYVVQNNRGGPIYITLPNQFGVTINPRWPSQLFPSGGKFVNPAEIPGRVELNLPWLTFSW